MKRYISALLIALPMMVSPLHLSAVPAYPKPLQITQPDGSTITVRIHGDEFLNWTTCGNALVTKGNDGFYHYASFEADGRSSVSGGRITSTVGGDGSSVRPPESALMKAADTRARWMDAARSIKKAAAEQNAVTGEDHFLVMLVDFSDLQFTVGNTNAAFTNLLNELGYSEYGSTGSARDYYTDQSNGRFKPNFDVKGPYTVAGSMSSYAADDYGCTQNGAPKLLKEACTIADPEIDFSKYDYDGDGEIDNVFFYYAGYNSAYGNAGTIWPHQWYVSSSPAFDGVRLSKYACTSEYNGVKGSGTMASIGTFCHEFAHTIGLPDFYDTDYKEQGEGYGLGYYSLMSSGSYNNDEKTPPYLNCEERMLLGWMDEIPLMPAKSKIMTLEPVQGDNGYKVNTEIENEYFYYEYRNGTGWDAPLRPGLVIYHVDKSKNVVEGYTAEYRWENWYGINAVAEHPCFRIMRADAIRDIVPFGENHTKFTSTSSPAARSWADKELGYDLTEITHDGQKATFRLNCSSYDLFSDLNICAIETGSNLKAGDTFKFELVEIENAPSSVKWYFDDAVISSESVVLTAGEHTVKAEVFWSNGDSGYYTASINVK